MLSIQKQDESLLEDVWVLLRAGRLEEACDLCRSAGQVCGSSEKCMMGYVTFSYVINNCSSSMDFNFSYAAMEGC